MDATVGKGRDHEGTGEATTELTDDTDKKQSNSKHHIWGKVLSLLLLT